MSGEDWQRDVLRHLRGPQQPPAPGKPPPQSPTPTEPPVAPA